ncbi:MAG: acetate--CoA ligase family protein [Methanomassiliicoccales archaeon]|jgi:succinyl-CoA synthetase beta subunit|nr:acetate--CoA ligase family protein [Methanomassiliicoccales archaeon]
MRLLEYQAKELLRPYSIPVPKGFVIRSFDELKEMPVPAIIKAQVPVGGRGKAGAIKKVMNSDDARNAILQVLQTNVNGYFPKEVLVEEYLNIAREFYIGITIDRGIGLPIILASPDGGIDIEDVPDDRIGRFVVHPFIGVQDYHIREILSFIEVPERASTLAWKTIKNLWNIFWSLDCELLEINPLVLTDDDQIVAADAKMVINDDALFRHQEFSELEEELTPLEREARKNSLVLVQLDGDIAVIANGAGLTMATLDNLSFYGGRGGLFLDLGGTDDSKKVECALELALRAKPKVVLINIFGGMTRCDSVASGIISVKNELGLDIPIVIRLKGTNEKLAQEMLRREGFHVLEDLDEACKIASELGGS